MVGVAMVSVAMAGVAMVGVAMAGVAMAGVAVATHTKTPLRLNPVFKLGFTIIPLSEHNARLSVHFISAADLTQSISDPSFGLSSTYTPHST